VPPATAILKTLHPGQGVADGIGIVAVKIVAVACKKRLETLKPADVGRAMEPVVVNDFFSRPRMLECLEPVSGTLPQGGVYVCGNVSMYVLQ
jgi:hypothetical protein